MPVGRARPYRRGGKLPLRKGMMTCHRETPWAVATIGVAFALAMAGCSAASDTPGDKAGGSTSTVTLVDGGY